MTKLRFYSLLLTLIAYSTLLGQWSTDPTGSYHVRTSGGPSATASDGNGGVFVVHGGYCDEGYHWCLNLDRLDKWGYLVWQEPIPITGSGEAIEYPQLLPADDSSVFCAFFDKTFIEYIHPVYVFDYKVRVNRYDSLGTALWGDGVVVSLDTLNHGYSFFMVSDGDNGCFISWQGFYDGFSDDYGARYSVQHISGEGERLWGDEGILIHETSTHTQARTFPIVSAGSGGFFLHFETNWDSSSYRKYDYEGILEWETRERYPGADRIIDYNGELIIAGISRDVESDVLSLKLDRTDALGEYLWDTPLLIADSLLTSSAVIGLDHEEDSITTVYWRNYHFPDGQSYIQRITTDGEKIFEGRGITPFAFNSLGSSLINSNENYIIVSGSVAQKISPDGTLLWGEEGLRYYDGPGYNPLISSDLNGGFISVLGAGFDGYWAQQVSVDGVLGFVHVGIENRYNEPIRNNQLLRVFPNPFNPSTHIEYRLREHSDVSIVVYDVVGREVITLISSAQGPGSYAEIWAGLDYEGHQVAGGLYFARLQAGEYSSVVKMVYLE